MIIVDRHNSKKERLDILLVEKNLTNSRESAKRLIMAGKVLVDDKLVDKAGTVIYTTSKIRITGNDMPYVSRGGFKIAKAIETFSLILRNKIAMDIGASTGGFTDCMLQNGASKVYAIDVGYGQLDWRLRTDNRVINMERTNIRQVSTEDIGEMLDFISIDVAFISLGKVLPVARDLIKPTGEILALIKPQFEAGRENVGKNGIVKDAKIHEKVIHHLVDLAKINELIPIALTYSPIKGPKGNIEYLLYMRKNVVDDVKGFVDEKIIKDVVTEAHIHL